MFLLQQYWRGCFQLQRRERFNCESLVLLLFDFIKVGFITDLVSVCRCCYTFLGRVIICIMPRRVYLMEILIGMKSPFPYRQYILSAPLPFLRSTHSLMTQQQSMWEIFPLLAPCKPITFFLFFIFTFFVTQPQIMWEIFPLSANYYWI